MSTQAASRGSDTYLQDASLEDVERVLATAGDGLTTTEVSDRRQKWGFNEITEKRANPLLALGKYFWGPIPWMIEIALVLSVLVSHVADAAIIAVLLAMNGFVGWWEERQASDALAALQNRLATTARVRRDCKWTTIARRELVPGDIIRLQIGDIVPGDSRLYEDTRLSVDQSALTGESLPVSVNRGGFLYSGSVITRGEGTALVVATGLSTVFGRTAQLVKKARPVSHFQQAVLKIGDFLIALAAVLVVVTVTIEILRGRPILSVLEFGLVLAIAAVPVALPAVLSVTMAIGSRGMARQQAVVTHLPAVEEIGGMDILCCDKTGTLTQNRLSLGTPWLASSGIDVNELLQAAALASRSEDRDPIDAAILQDVDPAVIPQHELVDFLPFDPATKRTEATILTASGDRIKVSKGAPQVISALADPDTDLLHRWESTTTEYAKKGYRVLGVARADTPGHWRLLGLLPLADPPRPDSAATISQARELGVDIKMITGDDLAIAAEIGAEVGIGTRFLTGSSLDELGGQQDQADPGPAISLVDKADGFARVLPEHKYNIVRVLQRAGHIVGMTGDGVNDAPALKQADAGIAVTGATDAARDAADVVLLSPGLTVIVNAIRLSREIFQRMTAYATYRIAETLRVLLLITITILALRFEPVTATMIVLLAVLNDGAILTIAVDRARGGMRPEAWDMRSVVTVATALGVVGTVASFGLLVIGDLVLHADRSQLQTMMYLKLSVAGHLTLLITRVRGPFWSLRPATALLTAIAAAQAIATLLAVNGWLMSPIGWAQAGIVWAYAIIWFLVGDRVKLRAWSLLDHSRSPAVRH